MTGGLLQAQLYSLYTLRGDILAAVIFSFSIFMITFFYGNLKGRPGGIKRIVLGFLLSAAGGLVLGMTLFGREYNPLGRSFEPELFWSYKKAFFEQNNGLAVEILCNILLFIPWGGLLPAVWKRFEDWRWMLSAALLFSGGVELTQGVLRLGLFEFDDIFNNTLGALIGYGLYRYAKKLEKRA